MNREVNVGLVSSTLFYSYFVFYLTRKTYTLLNRIEILENNIVNIKERINDLELFKLKVYNHEVVAGRRAWDEVDVDMEFEGDFEMDEDEVD